MGKNWNYDYEDDWDDYRRVDGKRNKKGNAIQTNRKKKMKLREEFFESVDEQDNDNYER